MPDGRKEPKSKYTLDRGMPGAFEGETVTRRRFMTLGAHGAGAVAVTAFVLPALGFAAGSALFDRPPVEWKPIGAEDDFVADTYRPRVITEAVAFAPRPRPMAMPTASAMTFLVAPPSSQPTTSVFV